MRRRFGRRRRRDQADDGRSPIDASWLERIVSAGLVPVQNLEPLEIEGLPATVCRLGVADLESGGRCVVAYSPHSASEALLGLVAALQRMTDLDRGEAIAIAPNWDALDRRLLGGISGTPLPIRALAAPGLAGAPVVGPERAARSLPASPSSVGLALPTSAERLLFERALAGLAGLAAKHGGAVRGAGGSVELIVLARRVAALHAGGQGPSLEILEPTRAQHGLSDDNLAEVLDRLEGSVRKCLSDRRLRDSAGGSRARIAPFLARASAADWWRLWPSSAANLEPVDLIGTDADGSPILGVVSTRLDLPALAAALRAVVGSESCLSDLLRDAPAGARAVTPKLRIAATEVDELSARVLACFEGDVRVYDVAVSGSAAPRLSERAGAAAPTDRQAAAPTSTDSPRSVSAGSSAGAGSPAPSGRSVRSDSERSGRRRPGSPERSVRPAGSDDGVDRGGEPSSEPRSDEARDDSESGERQEGGRRRRRGRGRGRRPNEAAEASSGSEGSVEESPPSRPRFLELSAFDLDDGATGDDGGEEGRRGGRRPRSRSRGRSRRDGPAAGDDEPEPASDRESDPDLDEDGEAVLELADAPEQDETDSPAYDDEELQEEPLSPADRLRLEREKRRRAVIAAAAPKSDQPEEETGPVEIEASPLPRGRAAILACADRDSVFAALLLAREVRTVEGIWVYPQDELMRFFRSVATDLRSGSPLFLIGFEPRPSHDVLQAASLYRDRLAWFDHHEWPPEDLHALRGTIGAGMVHIAPGAGSSLPAVLGLSSRRSRFSDKLVDLATGRFTQHDWDRWGRLWWHRVGEIAARSGEQRGALESLLAGRPSDLAKEASRVPAPPIPPEAAFVASQDFRLVHFGDHAMVVAEVPLELDPGLAARILRERYGASLSLVRETGGRTCLLGSDDSRRAIDVGAMADHLAMKFAWVDSLPDADHVARVRIGELDRSPERLDEVISEIAMGRSILEG